MIEFTQMRINKTFGHPDTLCLTPCLPPLFLNALLQVRSSGLHSSLVESPLLPPSVYQQIAAT